MQKRASLKDIANKVGVSIALVSYVMNGQEKEKRVGAEVVKKIRKAAEELNYQPNQIARSLRMKSTKTIGLIVADIANPFFANLARIIENEAAKYGYTVVFGSSDEDKLKSDALITTLLNRQVDGFIIAPAEGTANQISKLVKDKIPVVLLDRYFPELSVSHIILDNFKATYEATEHLIVRGFKNITLVAYKSGLIHMKERIRGYTESMRDHKMEKHIRIIEVRFNHSREDLGNLFDSTSVIKQGENAVLFATNALSVSGLYIIQKRCLKIPDDYSFIGFDGGESFDLFNPPLNYVQQPLEEMGQESFRILFDLISGSTKVSQVYMSPSLIIRSSIFC